MNLYLLALILLLSGSGGIAISGFLMNIFGWFLLAILLVLMWDYKLYIFLFILSVLTVKFIKQIVSYHSKYKDETPQEREERFKTYEMIDEWRKRNNF